MAIAVPLIMAYAGATATEILVTSLALTAIGANAAIDKAAANVFGKDTVKIADIAGAVYMGYTGATGGFGGDASAAASQVSDVSSAADSFANGTESIADGASNLTGSELTAGADAGGALQQAAGGTQPAAFGQNITPDYGGNPYESPTPGLQPQPGATPTASANAPATAGPASTSPPVGAPPKPTPDSVWDGVKGAWGKMGDRTQGALLTVGGNLLAGFAKGSADAKQAADQRAYDSRYRSGSGLTAWAPHSNVYTPPGGKP